MIMALSESFMSYHPELTLVRCAGDVFPLGPHGYGRGECRSEALASGAEPASTPLYVKERLGYLPGSDACTFLKVSRFFCRPLIWSCISTSEEPNCATDPPGPPAFPAFSSSPPIF